MAVLSPPSYSSPGIPETPAYTRVPRDNERRLLLRARDHIDPVPEGRFTKSSRTGSLTLHLDNQDEGIALPVYGRGSLISGAVDILKTDNVSAVDIKIDGHISLKEIGGAGTSTNRVLKLELNIYTKQDATSCPSTLQFAQALPFTYSHDQDSFPLPPTFEFHLSGVPGFRAEVVYSLTATVTKTKGNLFGNHTTVSTPIIYFPRARPTTPLPLLPSPSDFLNSVGRTNNDWEVIVSTMGSRKPSIQPIITKLYIPAGRVFSIKNTLPFRLHISSSALSLATFLPCSPTEVGGSHTHSSSKGVTRVYVIRQTSVDVRNINFVGIKTDIFKVIAIGEASFRRIGDGADWAAWEGEIEIDPLVKVGSFKAGGLWVKDFVILSIIPPSPHISPLVELRQSVPIRLVTETYAGGEEFDTVDWSESEKDVKN